MNLLDLLPLEGKTAFLERRGYRTYPTSYPEFKELMLKAETWLRKKGVRKQDKIIIQAHNSVLYAALLLAIMRRGAVAVPLDLFTSEKQRKKIEKLTKAKLTLIDLHKIEDDLKSCKLCEVRAAVREDEVAEIVFTSGTTGDPKGVVLTHKNLMASLEAAKAAFPLKRIRFLSVLPLSHMLEQMGTLFLALSSSSTILFPNTQRYSELLDLIKYKRIHMMVAVPGILEGMQTAITARKAAYRKIVGNQFRLLGVGGAPLPKNVEKWWGKHALVFQGYGMTEAAPLLTSNILFKRKKGSVGVPVKGVQIRIKKGEIQAKGANITPGYYKNPKETVKLFDGAWLKTGDQGEIKKGYLFIKGREKDMILTASGLNVYPEDIDEKLRQQVKESCVVQKGNSIHAVFFTKRKDVAKVVKQVNKQLEKHQQITGHTIITSPLPKTPTGKVKRAEVLSRIKQKQTKAKDPLYQILQDLLQKSIKEKPLTQQGLDSLKRMELLAKIEEFFGVELPQSVIDEKTTPKQLLQHIQSQQPLQFFDFHLPLLRHVGRWVGRQICRGFCLMKEPKNKPASCIIAANHVSSLDVPILGRIIKGDYVAGALPVFFVEDGNWNSSLGLYFARFVFKYFVSAIPFGPKVGLERSMRFAAHVLDEGKAFILYPEGARSPDGKMLPFKPGIGYLLAHMEAPIVPMRTRGLEKIMPKGAYIPKRGKVTVKLGKPITFTKMSYTGIARKLKQQMNKL